MIRRMRSGLTIAALTAMLSACHSQPKAGQGKVSGEILPGSISDAMLPYDAVKSKAPLAPREAEPGSDNAADDQPADSAAMPASGDPAGPGVAASPTPAPAD